MPNLFSILQIIAAHVFPAINEELGAWPINADVWRAPGGSIITRGAPDFLAISKIESRNKSVRQHIALDENTAVVDNGRTGETPLQVCAFRIRHVIIDDGTDSQRAEVLFPAQISLHIVAVQSLGAKESYQIVSVGSHGAISVSRLSVAFLFWDTFVRRFIPKNCACLFVQA